MNDEKSVFEASPVKFVLHKEKVIKSIPKPHYSVPMNFKDKTVEIRCRIIQIRHKEFIELSMKRGNQARKFLSDENEWIDCNVPEKYDKHVIKEIYSYLDN